MHRTAYVTYEKDKAGWVNIFTHTSAEVLTLASAVAASPGNLWKCKFLYPPDSDLLTWNLWERSPAICMFFKSVFLISLPGNSDVC